MKIAFTYNTKEGLLKEFYKYNGKTSMDMEIPSDFFAEGDSPKTINAIIEVLRSGGHEVIGIEADDFALQQLEEINPDLVFNIAEGLYGDFRESYIPLICERLGLPYTGSDPLTLAICLNKVRTKEILSFYSIPTPAFKVFYPNQEVELNGLGFPAIVKPIAEGSSKGIFNDSVVDNDVEAVSRIREKISKYQESVVVEKFLDGDEFTVAIWGNNNDIEVLPIVSINYSDLPEGARPIYSYEAKWIWDTPQKPLEIFKCPAELSSSQEKKIKNVVRNTYQVLGIRDWCRIDIRLDNHGMPNILELNPLPGILPNPEDNSCFPKAARTAGYSYETMINRVVQIAMKRYGMVR